MQRLGLWELMKVGKRNIGLMKTVLLKKYDVLEAFLKI